MSSICRQYLVLLVGLRGCAACTTIPGNDYKYNGHKYRAFVPAGDGPFPLLGFFHALFVKGWTVNGYCDMLEEVANAGYSLVFALEEAEVPKNKVIEWVEDTLTGAALQQLPNTDYNNVGIFGHSMGGGAVVQAMASDTIMGLNVKAGFALHPWMHEAPGDLPSQAKGPIAYTTGSKDSCVPHEPEKVRNAFDTAPSPKIFANLDGANHFEPLNAPLGKHRWTPYVASFFDCFLKGDPYGTACGQTCEGMSQDPGLPLVDFDAECSAGPAPPPSPAWQPGQIMPMADTGKCLDLVGGDTSNGNPIWLWECNGHENQAWTFASDSWMIMYQADPSKCIDAGDMSDGKQLQIWDCNGMDQQIWGFDADKSTIYLANSAGDASKCMDLAGGDTSAGNAIQIWDCNDMWNQQWYPPSDSGGAVTITLESNTNICLDLPGGDTTDGTAVWVWDCNGMDSQKWMFASDSWQIVYAGDPSKCLDAGIMDGFTQLQIWSCNGLSQQTWGYDQDSGSVYLADSATDASLCMDLAGDNEVAGTTVSAYSCNGMNNQKWSIWGASAKGKAISQSLVV